MATICALIAAVGYSVFLSKSHHSSGSPKNQCLKHYFYFVFMYADSDHKNTNYGALYLQIIGSYAAGPCLHTWNVNNVQPHYRRATAIAIGSMGANAGGIVSTWLFTDPPRFRKAARINLAFSLGTAASSVGIFVYLRFRNTQKRREVQQLLQLHGDGTRVGGWDSHPQNARDLETAILGSSSQCRPICRSLVVRFTQKDCHE